MQAEQRLRTSAEFRRTIREGRRCSNRLVVVYAATSGTEQWAAGFVVSRAVGKSVVRHRLTRRLRSIVELKMEALGATTTVVIRALPAAAEARWAELDRAVGGCLERVAV